MSVARYIVAGLGAAGSVSALPQSQYGTTLVPSHTTSASYGTIPSAQSESISATTPVPSYATSASYSTVPSDLPGFVPTITQPSTAPAPSDTAAAAAASASLLALAREAGQDITNVARFNRLLTVDGAGQALLPPDELRARTVFDFTQARAPAGADGGRLAAANVGTFPILVDQGLSTTVGFLEPCSMNSPHTHPRAAEWYTVVQGAVRTGFMLENGFLANGAERRLTTEVPAQLNTFQGTVFPMGSIHFQFNDNCSPATFVATLNSEDPGTSQIPQNFFFQDDVVVNVTLGEIQNVNGQNIEEFRGSLPVNLVQAVESCLARCGLQ